MSTHRASRSRSLPILLATVAGLALASGSARASGVGAPFCFGDGSSGPCPCGNTGNSNAGCDNSFATGGGVLVGRGMADLMNGIDSVTLDASSLPHNTLGIFLQTDAALSVPMFFGDGLSCTGGNFVRFTPQNTGPFGLASFPAPGDCALHDAVQVPCHNAPGDLSMAPNVTRYYTFWYRNPAIFCTSASYNLTNTVPVVW